MAPGRLVPFSSGDDGVAAGLSSSAGIPQVMSVWAGSAGTAAAGPTLPVRGWSPAIAPSTPSQCRVFRAICDVIKSGLVGRRPTIRHAAAVADPGLDIRGVVVDDRDAFTDTVRTKQTTY